VKRSASSEPGDAPAVHGDAHLRGPARARSSVYAAAALRGRDVRRNMGLA
jgi:hypothetical protein